jgi:thymidylate kinase
LDKFLQLKFLNKSYPQKYHELKLKMQQSINLPILLKKILGKSSIEEIESLSVFKFRLSLLKYFIIKKTFKQISLLFLFLVYYIKNSIKYKGFSFGFTGPDGSGKTTIINLIIQELSVIYPTIKLIHFRPSIIPNLGAAVHKIKLKSEVDNDFSNPHRGNKTGKINSLIRLLYLSIDYIFGYFIKVRHFLHRRSVIVFDRYYTDVIADSPRTRIYLKSNFLYLFGKLFIPQLDYNILLTADTEVILSRKQELTFEGINNINANLKFLANKKNYYLINNNKTPNEAIQKILMTIFKEQHNKNLKSIK